MSDHADEPMPGTAPDVPDEPMPGTAPDEPRRDPATEHPLEAISALADGQLPPDEAAAVEAHVAACPPCQAVLRRARVVVELMRSLPPVEPPTGFFDGVVRLGPLSRRRLHRERRMAVIAASVVAAALVVALGGAPLRPTTAVVGPALGQLVEAHNGAAALERPVAANVPASMGPLRFQGVRDVDGWPQAVYTDGVHQVSVFARPGRLDWRRVPADASPVRLNGWPGWQAMVGDARVIVVQRGSVVVAVVAEPEAPIDPADAAAQTPDPDVDDGFLARLEAAGRAFLSTFGLRGS